MPGSPRGVQHRFLAPTSGRSRRTSPDQDRAAGDVHDLEPVALGHGGARPFRILPEGRFRFGPGCGMDRALTTPRPQPRPRSRGWPGRAPTPRKRTCAACCCDSACASSTQPPTSRPPRASTAVRQAGITPRGLVDCMIAAVALRHEAALLLRRRSIARVCGIELPAEVDRTQTGRSPAGPFSAPRILSRIRRIVLPLAPTAGL